MMNGTDLLEERAERGVARGAANVWANAQLEAAPNNQRSTNKRSQLLFRAALLVWIVGLIVVAFDQTNDDDSPIDSASQPGESEPLSIDDEARLPAPLVVDGMNLDHVTFPADPNFAGDDDFIDRLFPSNREQVIINDLDERGTSTIIFADPEHPFEGPILGLLLFESGGFRPWGVNVEPAQLEDLASQVSQKDGSWRIAESTGLVEVSRFDDDPWDMVRFGWQFDFTREDDRVTLQAEEHEGVAEWTWISRLASGEVENGRDMFLEPTTMLGEDALVLSLEDANTRTLGQNDTDTMIVWSSNDFVYRLTASTIRDNTAFSRPPDGDAAQLELVDREVWLDTVDRANRTPTNEWISTVVSAALMLILVASAVVFLVRRSYRSAAIAFASALITLTVWVVAAGSFGLPLFVILTAGLALAWWSWHQRDQALNWPASGAR